MGEIENQFGVLGEVDRAIANEPAPKREVADLLAVPREGSTVAGWSDRFGNWVVDAPPDLDSVPDVDSALAAMAAEAPPPGLRFGRLQTIAGLIRTAPERFGPGGSDRQKVVAALKPSMRDGRLSQAEDALDLFLRMEIPAGRGARELVRQVITLNLVDAELHTSLRVLPGGAGGRGVGTRVGASVPIPGVTNDDVDELLEPTSWPVLSPVWETMEPIDGLEGTLSTGTPRLYREVFTVSPRLQLTPVLEFVRRDVTNDRAARSLEYRLAVKDEQSSQFIEVDEGSILTRMVNDELQITTTKRVRFASPFDGPGLVITSGSIGYLDAFRSMVEAAIARCGQSR
jgi:hypothetical protein